MLACALKLFVEIKDEHNTQMQKNEAQLLWLDVARGYWREKSESVPPSTYGHILNWLDPESIALPPSPLKECAFDPTTTATKTNSPMKSKARKQKGRRKEA